MHKSNLLLFENIKKAVRVIWICALLASLIFYLFYGQELTASGIALWINKNTHSLLLIYCVICALRGLALLPSTPFIFAGILLFPSSPVLLLVISLACIFLSSAIIYYASEYMGFGEYFERTHPKSIQKIRSQLSHKAGFYFITGWSLLPFTPTDLMLYIASSIKLPFQKIIIPLMLGEAVICSLYIFNGVKLVEYLF